jgi:hypothetical protein
MHEPGGAMAIDLASNVADEAGSMLGRRLYEAAQGPKAFVLVEGGSHHNTNSIGQARYRTAMTELFGLRLR